MGSVKNEGNECWGELSDMFAIEPLEGLCKVNYRVQMFRLREKNSSHGSDVVDDAEGKNWLTLKWILFSLFPPPIASFVVTPSSGE